MRLTPEHLGIFTGDMFQPLMGHIRALEEDLASAREREKAVEVAAYRKALDTALRYRHGPINGIDLESAILTLISPSAQSALDSMIAELKAQTAAMLEKVVAQLDYDISCYDENEGAQRIALQIFRDKVRALISTDHAAAGAPFPADAKDQSRKE